MGVNSFRCRREQFQFRVTSVEMSTWRAGVIKNNLKRISLGKSSLGGLTFLPFVFS